MPGTRNILIVCIPVTLPSELTEKLVITITITNLKSLSRTSKIENKKKEEGHRYTKFLISLASSAGLICWQLRQL